MCTILQVLFKFYFSKEFSSSFKKWIWLREKQCIEMGHRHLNVKKKFGKYILYPASYKIIAGLLGGPEIRTPKEIIEYRFEILRELSIICHLWLMA